LSARLKKRKEEQKIWWQTGKETKKQTNKQCQQNTTQKTKDLDPRFSQNKSGGKVL
jgi:hypothetical protein